MNSSSNSDRPAKWLLSVFDGKTLISGHNDGKVCLNNYDADGDAAFGNKAQKICCLGFSGDGITVMCGCKSGTVDIWSAK